jgi:cytochrome P450
VTAPARFEDPAFYLDDPHATYRRLRADDPVHWYEEGEFWVLTKWDDIKFVSTNPRLFSSREISILSGLVERRRGERPSTDPTQAVSVNFMDPPRHAQYRKVASWRFTPKMINEIDEFVRLVIREVIERLPDGEPFDLIEALAEPIPVFVFSKLLGVPDADWEQVVEWATVIANQGSGQGSAADRRVIFEVVGPYLWDLTMQRRAAPTDDLLTLLTQAEFEGRPLSEPEIIGYGLTLLAAGSETTQSLIGGLGHVLTEFPEHGAALFADPTPARAGDVVEETLRWWTPVLSMARKATTDVPLRDKVIREGDGVLLLYPSANRDEERWDDVDVFDPTRPDASGHLGFGIGEHFCMGAHLARREGRIFLEELARRGRGLERAGEATPRASALIHTYDRFPVRLVT